MGAVRANNYSAVGWVLAACHVMKECRNSEVTAETNCFHLDSPAAPQFYVARLLCLSCLVLKPAVHRRAILMVISSAN